MKNFKKIFLIIFTPVIAFLPIITFAQTGNPCGENIENIGNILCRVGSMLNIIIPVLITLGIVYFVWGVVNYVIADGEEAKKKGKDSMIYGIIGFAVIAGLKGIVYIITNTFDLGQGGSIASDFIQKNDALISNVNVCDFSTISSPKLADLFGYATCFVIKSVIPLIIALAVAMFTWGVVQFVINDQEEAKRAKGKQFMIWGIIGLAVMVGVWGLVKILGTTFGIEYVIPQLK